MARLIVCVLAVLVLVSLRCCDSAPHFGVLGIGGAIGGAVLGGLSGYPGGYGGGPGYGVGGPGYGHHGYGGYGHGGYGGPGYDQYGYGNPGLSFSKSESVSLGAGGVAQSSSSAGGFGK
ncbi:neuropeptide-like protein 29 [Spodoptera frugiperda]|uniref:Neuropeptide-like protein 29 n=1 Tax=Spodoptera frugiperda TaxID=7108 RepID=A0A9R0EYU6_SPOFR|nr:neuropeptide-like protein 29 [Spodoptera frugiperda]